MLLSPIPHTTSIHHTSPGALSISPESNLQRLPSVRVLVLAVLLVVLTGNAAVRIVNGEAMGWNKR